jgi:hypothetical protein
MKKFICMLTVLLCSVMSLSAQGLELDGRWVAEISEDEDYGALIFLFEGDELTQAVYGESNVDGIGLVGVLVATPPAPFKLDGTKLIVTRDASQADFQVTKTEYIDKIKEAIKENPSMEETVKDVLDKAFDTQKVEMAKSLLYDGTLEIISCIDGELKMKDPEGEEFTFYLKGE